MAVDQVHPYGISPYHAAAALEPSPRGDAWQLRGQDCVSLVLLLAELAAPAERTTHLMWPGQPGGCGHSALGECVDIFNFSVMVSGHVRAWCWRVDAHQPQGPNWTQTPLARRVAGCQRREASG